MQGTSSFSGDQAIGTLGVDVPEGNGIAVPVGAGVFVGSAGTEVTVILGTAVNVGLASTAVMSVAVGIKVNVGPCVMSGRTGVGAAQAEIVKINKTMMDGIHFMASSPSLYI
jgi:hypothetical protein